MNRSLLMSLLIVGTPSVASAQGLDFLSQDIAVDITSSTVTRVEVNARIRAAESTDQLWMFWPSLSVETITVDGAPATLRAHPVYPDQVAIVDIPRLQAEEEMQVYMRMAGALDCQRGPILACVRSAEETVLIPTSVDMAWYLVNVYGNDPFVGQIDVRAPPGMTVAAGQGAPMSEQPDVISFRYDTPTELLGLHAVQTAPVHGDRVLGLLRVGDRDKMVEAVDVGDELLPLYEDRFGALPHDRTVISSIPRGFPFGGMGMIGHVLIGDYVIGELDYLLVQGIAHEVAHTWWGGVASGSDEANFGFFAEAFAEYSARWALGLSAGPEARRSAQRMNAVWYMYGRPSDAPDVAILDPDVRRAPAFVYVTYHKGSVVLSTLEAQVGEAAFTDALRDLLAEGPGGLTLDALASALPGVDVQQWLTQPGYPRFQVEATPSGVAIELQESYAFGLPYVSYDEAGHPTRGMLDVATGRTEHPLGDHVLLEIDPDWSAVRGLTPVVPGDVSFDGVVDGIDLIEIALKSGGQMPAERRRDGAYDPLYDLNEDRRIDDHDLRQILVIGD